MKPLQHKSIKLHSWLKESARKDLDGFVGHLDEIVPDIIKDDDIYGKDRLTRTVKAKDVGAISDHGDWNIQFLWWNSESQSNWLDGLVRHAYLLNDKTYIEKVKSYIDNVLSYQDEDGYIGIYDKDMRYDFDDENGELWAQSSFFRVALGYYEYTKDTSILEKIEKAFHVTMKEYSDQGRSPFKLKKDFSGVCHGLTLTDACYLLYKYTNKKEYLDYALYLFQEYDKYDHSESDILTKNLLDPTRSFHNHGVHTYEHLRSLLVADIASGGTYKEAINMYLQNLYFTVTPSGGPIGDEWIFNRSAHASNTGYEYCSIHELLVSYVYMLEYSQDLKWADKIEWIFHNASYGARHPKESQIAYCKTDNSYQMLGDGTGHGVGIDRRYKYSSAHQDVAVCCVPNAGRILPYYVEHMVLQDNDDITIALYGPASTTITVDGTPVTIKQETHYPFDLIVNITIDTEYYKEFTLNLRIPSWASHAMVNGKKYTGDKATIHKHFSNDVIEVTFVTSPSVKHDVQGEEYITYGPLLYALPIKATEITGRTYIDTYTDKLYTSDNFQKKYITENTQESLKHNNNNSNSFLNPPTITGEFQTEGKIESLELQPIGSTILRQVTFKKK